MERSKSLAPHTGEVFEAISRLECIKPFTLVGGTALSLQIEKRQSEDLDFMKWLTKRNEKPEINWPSIKKELESIGTIKDYEVGGFDFVSFNFEGVKLSFYAAPRKEITSMKRIPYLNNLFLADMESIGAMKMEAMLRRAKFRDYYDIYSILKEGGDINKMIEGKTPFNISIQRMPNVKVNVNSLGSRCQRLLTIELNECNISGTVQGYVNTARQVLPAGEIYSSASTWYLNDGTIIYTKAQGKIMWTASTITIEAASGDIVLNE